MRDYSIPLSDTNQNKGTMALFLSHTPYNVMKQGQKKKCVFTVTCQKNLGLVEWD
jgi:hypothetical protein